MARGVILDKLGAILGQAPRSEAEVVYVLVEIRKFLEGEGEEKEEGFSTLKFFCDWVAHAKLSFAGAKKVLARVDPEIGASGSVNPREVQPNAEFYRLMSLEPLLEEIKRFYVENDLPKHWAFDPTMWREFTRLYGKVVLDCPLAISRANASSRYIKRLTLTNAGDLQDHPDKRTFSWDWSFELSDGDKFVLTCEYSYPSPSYDPSRLTTAEFGL